MVNTMKINTTGFWISLSGAILILLQSIGNIFGFKIEAQYFNEIITSICGVLVVVGVLIPTKNENKNSTQDSFDIQIKEFDNYDDLDDSTI